MDNRPKIISGIVTAALAILIIALLVSWKLSVNAHKGKQWPPVKDFEVIAEEIEDPETFVSTYSSAADDIWEEQAETDDPGASDVDSDADTQTSYDLNNGGEQQGHHANLTSASKESPVQQKTVKEGTAKPDDSARLEAERQQKAKKNIDNKLANRFSGTGKGDGGKTDPKADGTKNNNGPGGNEPLTYSASVDERPRSSQLGTIRIGVVVLEGGVVKPGSAQLLNGSGNAATNTATVNACKKAAERCRFKRASNDTAPRSGIVVFKWED
ncbi:MAG: hypothetical protein K2G06_09465 [Muribaculaceae bacterium]|nr:hypothetical protein [Muribaculaceae bacterium]